MNINTAAIFGCEGTRLTAEEIAFYRDANPWGFIVFARNLETSDQIRALTDDMRNAVGWDAPVLIDQESGRVQRVRPPVARDWPPPLDTVTAAGDRAAEVMALRFRIIADELKALGIDVNCVPVLDIAGPETHPFLQNRCYGSDAASVARIGRAVANAQLKGGVLPVLKHMPGHGRTLVDSHMDLPRATAPLDELDATDFAPFHALNDLPLGMTAHIVVEALDDKPATQSRVTLDMVRQRIGFQGLLMTDDISMEALEGDVTTRSERSIAAGCDLVLHCNGKLDEMRAVAAAAGGMSEAATRRGDAALALRKRPEPVDIAALEAQLEALTSGQGNG